MSSLSLAFIVVVPFVRILSLHRRLCPIVVPSPLLAFVVIVPFARIPSLLYHSGLVVAPSPSLAFVVTTGCPSSSSIEFDESVDAKSKACHI
ncbi:hypothetical protein HN51_016812 [Arachis hypogaea]